MKIEIHKTTMMDGDEVTDVDIMTNTRDGVVPRCILTFNDPDEAGKFAKRLCELCEDFGLFANINEGV